VSETASQKSAAPGGAVAGAVACTAAIDHTALPGGTCPFWQSFMALTHLSFQPKLIVSTIL
jgi:hypothetical protein